MQNHRNYRWLLAAVALAFSSVQALAEDGVSKDKILFGQVAALSGPAQALGQGMQVGILAAFEEANRALVGTRTKDMFRLGGSVNVRLVEAAPFAGALRFEIVRPGSEARVRSAGGSALRKSVYKGKRR